MLKNYLKIALRNLRRHPSYSLIKVSGLAIGLACCMLILIYVQHELAFDRHHENSHRIYRLVLGRQTAENIHLNTSAPSPLAPALAEDFPQVLDAIRFLNPDNPVPLVSRGDKRFYEQQFFFVDPGIFRVFTMPLLRGDPQTALQEPNAVVITEETAQRYFGDEEPLGKRLTFNNFIDLEVTGVVQSPPPTSTLQYDLLTSFSTLYGWLGEGFVDNWQNNTVETYIFVSEGFSPDALALQLPRFIETYLGKTHPLKQIHLQPLHRIHLYTHQDYGLASVGEIRYVYLLSAVALFILLIGCINFMNLATARSVYRSREVGIRKVVGATRKQLIQQFLGEAALLTGLALLAAIVLVELSLPYFSTLIGRKLSVVSQGVWLGLGLIGLGLLAGLVSSSYPVFVLSAFQPIRTLKGSLKATPGGVFIRTTLVVVQFAIAIGLIIGTGVVYKQVGFLQNKRLGFEQDQIVVVPIRDERHRQHTEPLKSRLRQHPDVQHVTTASLLPGGPVGRTPYRAEGMSEDGTMSMLWVDHDFIEVLGMEVIAGRAFSEVFETDAAEAFVLNEEAVRQLGWADPAQALGKSFELVGSKKGRIIGVVKDFHFASLRRAIEPIVLHIWPWSNYALIRVEGSRLAGVIDDLETIWQDFEPNHPFTFTFLEERFDRFYQSEKQLGRYAGLFALLAVSLACLGLFGLAAFTAERRTKEIGIRKVLGASVSSIIILLSKDFLRYVIIAFITATPLAYLAMQKWLEDFAYRFDPGVGLFLLAGGLALFVATVTVSYQAMRAALADPVKSLRYE